MKMLRLFLIMTTLTGILYPLFVTALAHLLFPAKSHGSLVIEQGRILGSELIAQPFTQEIFFHSRPSATNYATVPSGASNQSPTHAELMKSINLHRALLPEAGIDAWTSSGSGLDPHISPRTALAQLPRVMQASGMNSDQLRRLVELNTEKATLGIWGQPRVNVLELNLALRRQR